MAQWKKLSDPDGKPILVNLDTIAWMSPISDGGTALVVAGARSDSGQMQVVNVRQRTEEILAAPTIRSA